MILQQAVWNTCAQQGLSSGSVCWGWHMRPAGCTTLLEEAARALLAAGWPGPLLAWLSRGLAGARTAPG